MSLDREPAIAYNGSYLAPTQVAEGCIRYFRAGLSSSEEHSITVTGHDPNKFITVDWIQLIQVSQSSGGGGAGGGGNGGSQPSPGSNTKKSSSAGVIAGGIVGGTTALLAALGLFFFLRRRRRSIVSPTPFAAGTREGSDGHSEKLEAGAITGEAFPAAHLAHNNDSGVLGSGPASGTVATGPSTPAPSSGGMYGQVHSTSSFPSYSPSSPTRSHHQPSPAYAPSSESRSRDATIAPASVTSSNSTSNSHPSEKQGNSESARVPVARRVPPSVMTGSTAPLSSLVEVEQSSTPSSDRQRSNSEGGSHTTGNMAAALSQVSRDVNRILTQLGSLRITPGEPVDEDHPVLDEIQSITHVQPSAGRTRAPSHDEVVDEAEPPQYEDHHDVGQHHR